MTIDLLGGYPKAQMVANVVAKRMRDALNDGLSPYEASCLADGAYGCFRISESFVGTNDEAVALMWRAVFVDEIEERMARLDPIANERFNQRGGYHQEIHLIDHRSHPQKGTL